MRCSLLATLTRHVVVARYCYIPNFRNENPYHKAISKELLCLTWGECVWGPFEEIMIYDLASSLCCTQHVQREVLHYTKIYSVHAPSVVLSIRLPFEGLHINDASRDIFYKNFHIILQHTYKGELISKFQPLWTNSSQRVHEGSQRSFQTTSLKLTHIHSHVLSLLAKWYIQAPPSIPVVESSNSIWVLKYFLNTRGEENGWVSFIWLNAY